MNENKLLVINDFVNEDLFWTVTGPDFDKDKELKLIKPLDTIITEVTDRVFTSLKCCTFLNDEITKEEVKEIVSKKFESYKIANKGEN